MKTKTKKEARYKMNKINRKKQTLKTNPFTHEEIKQAKEKVKKAKKEFEEAIEIHLISTNYSPKKKTNYYKLLDITLQVLAYLSLATILSYVAILWIIA